jgi:hypothetical protein
MRLKAAVQAPQDWQEWDGGLQVAPWTAARSRRRRVPLSGPHLELFVPAGVVGQMAAVQVALFLRCGKVRRDWVEVEGRQPEAVVVLADLPGLGPNLERRKSWLRSTNQLPFLGLKQAHQVIALLTLGSREQRGLHWQQLSPLLPRC